MIYRLGKKEPSIKGEVYVAESADVIGDVELYDGVNIWFGAVLRGDIEKISVGKNSNIQDNATVHTDYEIPCIIGENVTVGHNVILHSCTIGNNTLVGMGSTVLNGAKIGSDCMIGANSLVTHSISSENGVLILGSPAKVVRKLTDEEIKKLKENANHYVENGKIFSKELEKI